jgi:hypothetical protein
MRERPSSDEEAILIDRLRKIEALFARPGTTGEKEAARNARDRIEARLRELQRAEALVEYRYSLHDPWSRWLFIALVRRYGITPYRRTGQRRSTIMIQVAPTFLQEVLEPEFRQLNATLLEHLEVVTKRIIAEAIHRDGAEPEERHGGARD